ncbi:FMN-dependent NADH-azoreductase [Sphingomonas sp. GlSt437]|uniref:FMN-dependent NADH-azoreductase n=1 Tax=Sphingomonas sp. GlSt437 TaxID=3389970 RepID=UPI003A85F837
MSKLLFVKSSPRGEASKTNQIAREFVTAWQGAHPTGTVEELDVFNAGLPEYAAEGAIAKMAHFGEGELAGDVAAAWERIKEIFNHFNSFDEYLFAIPMWNFGVPYKLKQYADILSQPGLMFGFDPAQGYIPLLKGKRATAIYSAGIWHEGASKAFGVDYASTHWTDFLNFAGIEDVTTIWYEKYKMLSEIDAAAALDACKAEARAAAVRPR